jgi:hypothetical protein
MSATLTDRSATASCSERQLTLSAPSPPIRAISDEIGFFALLHTWILLARSRAPRRRTKNALH